MPLQSVNEHHGSMYYIDRYYRIGSVGARGRFMTLYFSICEEARHKPTLALIHLYSGLSDPARSRY